MKNTRAMLPGEDQEDRGRCDRPITAEKAQKDSLRGVAADGRDARPRGRTRRPSGASITTHLSGLVKMDAEGRERDLPAAFLGHGEHMRAERDDAGDAETQDHIIIDAQHIGAQALVDHAGFGAADGRALRVSSI